jgi:hypothetical protein
MIKTATAAFERICDKYGYDETTRNLNPITDPADREIFSLAWALMNAHGSLGTIASGAFKSTEDKPVYAGGVVSPGNRIFTPAEGAQHALERLVEIEDKYT